MGTGLFLYDGAVAAARQVEAALGNVPGNRVPIVALQAVNPVDGATTDMAGIGKAVHDRDGLVFVDACHAVGQLPVQVGDMACDVLVFPARKWLRGARGVSVLYLSDRALAQMGVPPSLDIASAAWVTPERYVPHPDRRRFEAFECNPGLRLALKAACEYAVGAGLENIAAQAMQVRQKVADALAGLPALQAVGAHHPTALMTYRIHVPGRVEKPCAENRGADRRWRAAPRQRERPRYDGDDIPQLDADLVWHGRHAAEHQPGDGRHADVTVFVQEHIPGLPGTGLPPRPPGVYPPLLPMTGKTISSDILVFRQAADPVHAPPGDSHPV